MLTLCTLAKSLRNVLPVDECQIVLPVVKVIVVLFLKGSEFGEQILTDHGQTKTVVCQPNKARY